MHYRSRTVISYYKIDLIQTLIGYERARVSGMNPAEPFRCSSYDQVESIGMV